jgi:hypothetical protein
METKYQDRTPEERLEMLKANCYHSELQNVKVYFTEEEMADMKSALSEESITRNGLEEELSEIGKELRNQIKQRTQKIKELLKFLKNGFEEQKQEVFEFDDQETGLMLTYNNDGELINSRKLLPSERQTKITSMTKTA